MKLDRDGPVSLSWCSNELLVDSKLKMRRFVVVMVEAMAATEWIVRIG